MSLRDDGGGHTPPRLVGLLDATGTSLPVLGGVWSPGYGMGVSVNNPSRRASCAECRGRGRRSGSRSRSRSGSMSRSTSVEVEVEGGADGGRKEVNAARRRRRWVVMRTSTMTSRRVRVAGKRWIHEFGDRTRVRVRAGGWRLDLGCVVRPSTLARPPRPLDPPTTYKRSMSGGKDGNLDHNGLPGCGGHRQVRGTNTFTLNLVLYTVYRDPCSFPHRLYLRILRLRWRPLPPRAYAKSGTLGIG